MLAGPEEELLGARCHAPKLWADGAGPEQPAGQEPAAFTLRTRHGLAHAQQQPQPGASEALP